MESDALQSRSVRRPPVSAGRLAWLAAGLLAMTAAVALLCSLVGPYRIAPAGGWSWAGLFAHPVWRMRLLRLLAAAAVGGGLAVGGVAVQGLMRNPLAEPYVLGISTGAGVGVRLGVALAMAHALPAWAARWVSLPVLAFTGALTTCLVVYGIAQRRGRLDPYSLILSGVIVNVFNGALMMGLFLFIDPFRVDDFARWAMGEIPDAVSPALLAVGGGLVAAGAAVVFLRSAALNAMGLGHDVARSIGVPVARLRIELFIAVGGMTAAAVMLSGPIGFVGLIVPHICRMAFGPDHRSLTIHSGFCGAMLLMAGDTLCRNAGTWLDIGRLPVGVVTALLGGPFFIVLMRRGWREAWS